MNKYRHCYAFANEEKAARFYIACMAEGHEVEWTGNVVFANGRVYADVHNHFYIEPDEQPIWMSDHE